MPRDCAAFRLSSTIRMRNPDTGEARSKAISALTSLTLALVVELLSGQQRAPLAGNHPVSRILWGDPIVKRHVFLGRCQLRTVCPFPESWPQAMPTEPS